MPQEYTADTAETQAVSVTADRPKLRRDLARKHVELLTGSADTRCCFRLLSPGNGRKLTGTLDDRWPEIAGAQDQGLQVYIVVNEGGHNAQSISRVRALFVDGDGVPTPPEWHKKPDFIVRRDDMHWHAYWLVADMPLAEFREAQHRLANYYHTDPKVCDLPRIMRLAGTLHLKDPAHPYLVTIEGDADTLGPCAARTTADLLQRLPAVNGKAPGETKEKTILEPGQAPNGFQIDSASAMAEAWGEARMWIARGDLPHETDRNNWTCRKAMRLHGIGVGDVTAIGILTRVSQHGEPPEEKIEDIVASAYRTAEMEGKEPGRECEAAKWAGTDLSGLANATDKVLADVRVAEDAAIEAEFMCVGGTAADTDGSEAVDINKLLSSASPAEILSCLAKGWLGAGHSILLSGPGGSHKSRLLLQWCLGWSFDLNLIDPEPPGGIRIVQQPGSRAAPNGWFSNLKVRRIEYLNYENKAEEMHRRVERMQAAMRIGRESSVPFTLRNLRENGRPPLLVVSDRPSGPDIKLTPFGHRMLREWKKSAGQSGHMVIVLDSLFNAVKFTQRTKVSDDCAQQVVYVLDHWCEKLNATIFAPFHPSRAGVERGDFGHSANFENTPRQCLTIAATQGAKARGEYKLTVLKWNDAQQGQAAEMVYDAGVLRAVSETGRQSAPFAAAEIVLKATYRDDLEHLHGAMSEDERQAIEVAHPDRLRKDGGGKWGQGNEATRIDLNNPMVREFEQRTGTKANIATAFLKACEEAEAQSLLGYHTATAGRAKSRRPAGYCYSEKVVY